MLHTHKFNIYYGITHADNDMGNPLCNKTTNYYSSTLDTNDEANLNEETYCL